jgi:predicted acylesterase/phospholipase RssA
MHNSYGCGTIIGVNVCRIVNMQGRNQYGNSLSGWEILGRQLNPFAKPINAPGAMAIMECILDLNTADRSEEQRRLTDLYIRPPIESYEAQDFEKYQEIIAAGYKTAQPLIKEWLATGHGLI